MVGLSVNLLLIAAFLYLMKKHAVLGSSICETFKDCFACMKHFDSSVDNCTWCPIDRTCQQTFSASSSCNEDQNLVEPHQCYDKTFGVYNPNSAYVNTLLSSVAYSMNPQQCSDKVLPDAGITLVESIGRKCEQLSILNYKYCFAYTALSKSLKLIIVAFKGTDGGLKQLLDEGLTYIKEKETFQGGGKVQQYFYRVFMLLYSCVKASIRDLFQMHPTFDVVVTGHSLGGALASLAAAHLVNDQVIPTQKLSLYTFGMPRVGDKDFSMAHDRLVNNSWRVVHNKDIVAHLPPCGSTFGTCTGDTGPFHHGKEVFYRADMTLDSKYDICHKNENSSCSNGVVITCVFDSCIGDHTSYFGIPVGSYCDTGLSGKRSVVDEADFWSEFEEDKCMRIPFNQSDGDTDMSTSGGTNIVQTACRLQFLVLCLITSVLNFAT